MRGLHQLCVGSKGKLVPLSVLPIDGAIPQIISLPPAAEEETAGGGYYVAYTTVPQARMPASASAFRVMGATAGVVPWWPPSGYTGRLAVCVRASMCGALAHVPRRRQLVAGASPSDALFFVSPGFVPDP